jgi:hypothetical protein
MNIPQFHGCPIGESMDAAASGKGESAGGRYVTELRPKPLVGSVAQAPGLHLFGLATNHLQHPLKLVGALGHLKTEIEQQRTMTYGIDGLHQANLVGTLRLTQPMGNERGGFKTPKVEVETNQQRPRPDHAERPPRAARPPNQTAGKQQWINRIGVETDLQSADLAEHEVGQQADGPAG